MEKTQQKSQYDYNDNSNLVLTSENRTRDSGPSGEVTSLVGKYSLKKMVQGMGSRVTRERPKELEDKLKKSHKRREEKEQDKEDRKKKRKIMSNISVLTTEVDSSYRPQTRETRAAYEVLLTLIQSEMGDNPHDVLRSAADEVLTILKDDTLQAKDKQKDLETLFRRPTKMDEQRFSRFYNVGKQITDFKIGADNSMAVDDDRNIDEDERGVPVFPDEEEDEESGLDEIAEDSDDNEDGVDTSMKSYAISSKLDDDAMIDDDEERENEVDVRTIDAFWIQRQISNFYKDPLVSQKMSEDVLSLLGSDETDGACENKLVLLLDYDKFNFIKLLLRNRLKVVWCTKLARAADDEEKEKIQSVMEQEPKLQLILAALEKTSTAADRNIDRGKELLKEARNLVGRRDGKGNSMEKTSDVYWNKRPKAVVDLDSLKFEAEGHFMSNADCKLPKRSQIINKKGYQEVHIPALKRPEQSPLEKTVTKEDMPEWTHKAFSGVNELNRVQSQVYDCALNTPENMLICAPTGSGKTNCALLTMMREIGLHRNEDGSIKLDAFKIVYIAPMKSLVQEMVLNFGKRLEKYKVTVMELSGDQQLTKQQINETQIIITTPEKWDIVTRKSGDRTYTQLVRLVIIDEVHLLHDSRGPVLESIVSRTIRQIESTQELIRLVGLSATLPNYEDVAMFLRVKPEKGLFFFDNSYRPVPLQQQFIGITQKKAFKRFQMSNEITYEKVLNQAGKNQVLIFVHSRKDTGTTARMLRDMALEENTLSRFIKDEPGRRELLASEAEEVNDQNLKDILPYGFAIHHAGMTRSDRTLVEELFADNHVQVLVSTATLAWGVNLPAHTVIIKGTQVYDPEKGRWTELSPLDVMQMIGRAGRSSKDKYGEGIIITSQKELHYYLSLQNEQLPIESQFMGQLADNLNAEIVMGAVQNVKEAVTWLGYSYLYVRMLRRPTLYGVSVDDLEADPILEQRRIDLVHTAAALLDKNNLIKYDRKTGSFMATDLGRVSSHYYISHHSMSAFNEYLKPNMSDIELFRVFSMSAEFSNMTIREEEKIELAKLLERVPIPIKENIDEASAKVNVLLQAYISRLKLEGFALISDMVYITQSAGRIMRALFEVVLKRGWAAVAVKCLNLCKMISHRMWGAQSPLRQFKGIPSDIIKRIEGKDFPWERFYDLEAHAIGELIRFPKMGRQIHKVVHQLPRLDLQGHVQPITRSVLRVELILTPDFQFDEKVHGYAEPFWIIVEDVDSETILHHEYFVLKSKFAGEDHSVNFTIPIFDPLPPQYYIRVVSDKWLGSEVVLPISFRHLILPERYPPPTELLDLQPLPVTELANEKYINYFAKRFEYFNPIQTQVFNTVYKRDDNTLLAAPTGSGKTVVAELAIFRMLQKYKDGRCVFIAPLEALAQERYEDWKPRFGRLNIPVRKLTGEASADLLLLQEGQIVISTPQTWDVMSRRWKTRKNVQNVKLFMVDELHLIGGDVGPILEVIVSRMRYIASQTEQPMRMLMLSTSVANAKDLGDWIGATSHGMFNFHPNVRPVPLEIRVQGFDINNFNARQLAMVKPTYMSVKNHSPEKPVLIFVPSRKQARRVAIDMMTFAMAEDNPKRFLHVDEEDIEPHLKHVSNKTLREALVCGIAFYHSGLNDKEKAVVNKLYQAGAIQIVVSEFSLCWGMTMSSHLVLIMGTQYYDGREHRYVDVPITDVVQMMGRASRPLQDTSGKCTIFCQSSKKEFYKKFLYAPFPVESHLDHYLHDHMNAEIITKRIENVQDAVDFLTWSFFYRRLTQNPNYYNLQGVSHRHLSDHLSEVVENVLEDLEQSKCINVEDADLSPYNLGMIAAYYYIKYTTVELFSSSLQRKTKLRGLLEIVSAASEFENVQVRHREDIALEKLSYHLPLKVPEDSAFHDPHTKTYLLMQAHFSRVPLSAAVKSDLDKILPNAARLLQAMVDVISSNGWLMPALATVELSQMVTQGMWNTDAPLMQVPNFTKAIAKKCTAAKIETIGDLLDMEDEDRVALLDMPPAKMAQVAEFCNAYPDIEMEFEVEDKDEVTAGSAVMVTCVLERNPDDDEEEAEADVGVPKVVCKRYPQMKTEGWWVIIGDPKKNELLSIKRVAMKKKQMKVALNFVAPKEGKYKYLIYLMSDSYLGCDLEYELKLDVKEGVEMEESDDDEDESDEEDDE